MSSDDMTPEQTPQQAESAAPAPQTVKRRPGRPRKTAVSPDGAVETQDAPADAPAPRRRTRVRVKEAAEQSADAPKTPRRRKAKAADADAAAPVPADAPAAEAAERPVVRTRPGRSTMLRAAVEASDGDQADARRAASDAAAEDKPVRRRPGRPPKARASEDDAKSSDVRDEAASAADTRERFDDQGEGRRSKRDRFDRSDSKQRDRRQERAERRPSKQAGERRQDRQGQDRGRFDRGGDRNDQHRRQRRNHGREPMVPKTTREDLAKLKVAELREKAAELELDVTGLKKAELVEKVFEASVRAEGFIEVEGVLDIMQDGYGFLRTKGYLPSENDVYVGLSTIRRNGLRKGDYVKGQTRPARENEKYAALQQVTHVNGDAAESQTARVKFGDLTPVFPDECLSMEHGRTTITARVIDLVSPIGKGQRGLIVSPPKAGKTTVLKDIAAAITANNPEVHLMCLLVDERPEEVTDMQRSIKGEVIASTFDMPTENHIAVSELVIERAKRLVERGEDVVILLDSLTRLARAYNLAQPASGRILSGGVDSTALYPPKRFLGAARNIEGGGSLTILASALIDTGSKMDEVIFEEFKGTGNMELKLDRALADRRVFPAIDPVASGTRREDLLLNPQEAPLIWAVRRILSNMNSTERAMDMLIKSLKQTKDNQEFLLRTAKKAQGNRDSDTMEF